MPVVGLTCVPSTFAIPSEVEVAVSHEAERILQESMRLPVSERASLVASLIASLEPAEGTADDVDAAWVEEIERRRVDAVAGVPFDEWQAVRRSALERLGHNR